MPTELPKNLLLEAVFDHLVLPPQLPAAPDDDAVPLNWELTRRVLEACKQMRCQESDTLWSMIEASLVLTQLLNRNLASKETIAAALSQVARNEANEWLVFHVVQQNAAVIIHKNKSTSEVVFEAFEASATAPAVLDTNCALEWSFPARSVAISESEFDNDSFQNSLADFLEQASEVAFDQFAARACKGDKMVVESRDTPSPALVTEMLMSFLEAKGRAFPVYAVKKRVRDDVVLGSSETPWRRSPYWLALRVALQRIILMWCDNDANTSHIHFKFLMCIVFSQFLGDCHSTIHPEKALMLQAKLCRRLAKLQTEMSEAPPALEQLYSREFSKQRSFFESTLLEAKRAITVIWDAHKRKVTRPIPLLPSRASQSDLTLKLSNSGRKLQELLARGVIKTSRHDYLDPPSFAEGTVTQINNVASRCYKLVVCTNEAMSALSYSWPSPEVKCTGISQALIEYMDAVGTYYVGDAILMSQYLLNLFELWVVLDSIATRIYPLLREYHPAFVPEALEMLCLMTRMDLKRLFQVQKYIRGRIERCSKPDQTIFSNPHRETAFPASFLKDRLAGSDLRSACARIEAASERSKDAKKKHLNQLMGDYDKLSAEIKKGVCCCTRMPDGSLNVKGCTRCWKARCRKRLKVGVHEAFLPENEMHKAAILFELKMPESLQVYRNATWRLLLLGKKDITRDDAAIVLADFGPLQKFQGTKQVTLLTLASRKKSFLQTHYRELKLPKSEAEVLLPFGPSFTYYDTEHGVWPDEYCGVPWYHHLLGSWLPQSISDPFAEASLYMVNTERPSSYEIAAHQDACPKDMSSSEFTAYQRAISGVYRRWIVLVSELGSTNLSLSGGSTLKLFARMALQAGPANTDTGSENLGKVHSSFQDIGFCESLEHQIRFRLNALDSGRKDMVCMSILINLGLRLHHLCPCDFRKHVAALLRNMRELLSQWISQLREELRSTDNGEVARKTASGAFWASLLCRQTFEVFDLVENEPCFGEEEALQFFRASIALSENLIVNLDDLSTDLRQLLDQDMTRAYSMSNKIREWTLQNSSALEKAINETWTDSGSSKSRSFSTWNFLDDGHWMTSRTIATGLVSSQAIHYHALQGHFLIDGKPLGRLPLEIREEKGISELFLGQHLLTRPSGIPGMEYQIVNRVSNHEVHVGLREGSVVIRAKFKGYLIEYVPREIFKSDTLSDLPSGLVDDCVHWLNLHTGELEMRRKPTIWQSKASNWVLNVQNRTAMRQRTIGLVPGAATAGDGTCLVEPQSEVGRKILQIFQDFESPGNLTIFQPLSDVGRLSVEIKRLEMRFFVNSRGVLQSLQLHSEIDPVQNIGTLHGLQSKLVLRNNSNFRRKSVIIPIGSFFWGRQGPHVSVRISNEGSYALFTVDPVLGRLSCAPEPALYYLKALIHAFTSFPIPDELTGRTGTEEACLCLTSAQSQPWKPLNVLPKRMLSVIVGLSPKRKFYPVNKRLYQNVFWDNSLTATIQHEQLAIHAGDILRQSQALDIPENAMENQGPVETNFPNLHHLALRGIIRRQIYERTNNSSDTKVLSQANNSKVYTMRGSNSRSKESNLVYRTMRQLQEKTVDKKSLQPLNSILQKWPVMDGFKNTFSTLDIQRNLSADASEAFGPFIRRIRMMSNSATDYVTQLSLALFGFGEKANKSLIAWLVALASNDILRSIEPPDVERFTDFNFFQRLKTSQIKKLVESAKDQYSAYVPDRSKGRKPRRRKPLSEDEYDSCVSLEAETVACWLEKEWPSIPVTRPQFEESCNRLELKYLNSTKVWTCLGSELQRLSQNLKLSNYVQSLEDTVRELRIDGGSVLLPTERRFEAATTQLSTTWMTSQASKSSRMSYQSPCLTKMFRTKHEESDTSSLRVSRLSRPSILNESNRPKDNNILRKLPSISKELSTLHKLVQSFVGSPSLIQQQYGQDLEDSIVAMAYDLVEQQQPHLEVNQITPSTEDINVQIAAAERNLHQELALLQRALSDQDVCYFWLSTGHLWPCQSLVTILEQLRLDNYSHLTSQLKRSLVHIGILVTKLQRLLRMHDAERCRDNKRLIQERKSIGHSNWNPGHYPEWLLLEIDNNMLIRPAQVEVAMAIISPPSNQNSVLQMNMGKGKTSVVMPMAALILADKSNLCRVVVPKALLLQTAQVIQSRIGGLTGRQVCHVPFARRSPSDTATLCRYQTIHEEMQASGGIMICLPANILSFKLSGLQRLADSQRKIGSQMVEIQRWLDTTCRDILDESDLTLSVYTQLIYPSGDLTVLDGHPYRWLVVEDLLSLVENHASILQKQFDGKVVVVHRHQGYPIIHFLSAEPEDALNELLVDDICNGRLPRFQIQESSSDNDRHHIRQIISGTHVSSSLWDDAMKCLKDKGFGVKILYLLRGLISERILLLCLKKKWNIQYGLHPERQPIAVPFEAKGVPSQASEYGHPDTALLLTCLAFYQEGLSKEQVKQGLRGVMQSDDAATHYDRWICSCASLPPTLQSWNSVDPENDEQMETLWQHVRFDRTVINHHLNTYVFPFYAKQFSVKLQASGWDIPLLHSNQTGRPRSLTTGFSGTNDNKRILPQTIRQDDLSKLLCTNAEVLCHLLETRNRDCHLAAEAGVRFEEKGTLKFLCSRRIRVLIDAGAHILEMENPDVAKAWLDIDHKADGAVYFGANGQIMVRSRFQRDSMPLIASPFANDLRRCVVYIDAGHTRGIDLNLPVDAKGAVTLALGQTKDQTVQAAMRLRQLGTTQSVAFLAPPEVYRSMLDVRRSHTQESSRPLMLTSVDVVRWLLEQSCKANEQMMGLHFAQCQDFCRRTDILWKHPDFATNKTSLSRVLQVIRQEEQQTLQQMYGPRTQLDQTNSLEFASLQLQDFALNVAKRARHGQSSCSSAMMEVEQEREVEFEIEQVRQRQSNTKHRALSFPGLDSAIMKFIETGQLNTIATCNRAALLQAFDYVGRTKIGTHFGIKATTSRLYVSNEYTHTITPVVSMATHEILRPTHWILWSPSSETGLIIIPEEADIVMPVLRKMKMPLVWLLGYTAPVTKSMRMFNCLTYLAVPTWPKNRQLPTWLSIEVGILSGRLYFEFSEYEPLLSWLGVLSTKQQLESSGIKIGEPLQFLQEWVAYRRRTDDILHTPVGFVCQRQHLHENHFLFRGHKPNSASMASMRSDGTSSEDTDDTDLADDMKWQQDVEISV